VVREATDAMDWLEPSDQAVVEVALRYARAIEEADDVKTMGWIGPHLINALRLLGGAPAERKSMGSGRPVNGRLAELRSAVARAGQHDSEAVDQTAS
jgi:hypothetical protein